MPMRSLTSVFDIEFKCSEFSLQNENNLYLMRLHFLIRAAWSLARTGWCIRHCYRFSVQQGRAWSDLNPFFLCNYTNEYSITRKLLFIVRPHSIRPRRMLGFR